MPVGAIFRQKGAQAVFRVLGPGNLVQRFTGSRSERLEVLREWRRAEKLTKRREVMDRSRAVLGEAIN